jgi:DNA modification methylase
MGIAATNSKERGDMAKRKAKPKAAKAKKKATPKKKPAKAKPKAKAKKIKPRAVKAAAAEPPNTLYYGNNLDVLREHVEDESVDLVYLDPPFNSNQDYNILFAERDGTQAAAQIKAFDDTWHWDVEAARAYQDMVEHGPQHVSQAMQAFRTFLGENDMLAYLSNMAPRLVELKRVLKQTGSLYLHCDPTASHYLKMLLDAVFEPVNFRNEIVWRRTGSHNSTRSLGSIHDIILFYTKSNNHTFNIVRSPYMRGHVESRYTEDAQGRMRFTSGGNVLTGAGTTEGDSCQPWRGFDPAAKGRHWAVPRFYEDMMPASYKALKSTEKLEALYKAGLVEIVEGNQWPVMVRYLGERDGVPVQDIWAYQPYTEETVYGTDEGIDADIAWMGPTDPERLGYQTQKPEGLLARIILASSNEGDIVLDPFCGCGTAVAVSQRLSRRWIGIDITHLAVNLMKRRLRDTFGPELNYEVIGEPVSVSDAQVLAASDPYQFQWWALGLVDARPIEKKKGADKGIDGRLYFHDEPDGGDTKQVIIQIKAGKVSVAHIRDLRGVIERENAQIGILICMNEPTQPMRKEAASAGFYTSPWRLKKPYARLQILTIKELLAGKVIDMPPTSQVNVTFKRAAKRTTKKKGKKKRSQTERLL